MPSTNFLNDKNKTVWDSILSEDAKDADPNYNKRPLIDKLQLAVGAYARPPEGGIVDKETQALMKYHGVDGLVPTKERDKYTFQRGGKTITVKVPRDPNSNYYKKIVGNFDVNN
jgi:hypothetical protein